MRGAALAWALAGAIGAAGAAHAQEARTLACETRGGIAFDILLFAPSEAGPPVHCVTIGTLAALTPCAPDGGWGLSDEAGALVALTADPGAAHDGGWFFADAGPSELVASASVGARPLALEVAGDTFWRLRMALGSGEGSMFTAEGEVPFACRPAPAE